MTKILIIGSGGREHAIQWALNKYNAQVIPGNGGTKNGTAIAVDDFNALIDYVRREKIDLTVVGPEIPLAAGIVDAFQAADLKIFGPTREAAKLEWSKAFAKQFMRDCGIPTAEYGAFTDYNEALKFIESFDKPVVVKADGLAAGKGVIVCDDHAQAKEALRRIMVESEFSAAGNTVVIEERLQGREVSLMAFSDGNTVVPMLPARDHKRVFNNDQGPNTGGMGAYAPVPDMSVEQIEEIRRTVLQPTIEGMAAQGTPYKGILYAGLMMTADGVKVLEFNCRFGDPETQVVLPLLETDLCEIMLACIDGTLDKVNIRWRTGSCATVVLASRGYPEKYPKGLPITFTDTPNDLIFHAGTARNENGQLVTSGGRVLAVSALGDTLQDALKNAYAKVETIHFDGIHYRRDIGVTGDSFAEHK